jgi:hypothetical protein
MSVLTRTTQRNISEDGILHSHHCENLKSYVAYCDVFGRMPSLLGNLKLDTPVVARQPKVKHFHGYARDSVLSRCMVA